MGVTTDVAIANLALARLGQDSISALNTATRDAAICTAHFYQNREFVLSMYDWVCLTSRIHMTRAGMVTITAATASAPPTIICSGHTFVTGDLVTIEDVNGMTELNGGRYVVFSYTSSCIRLYGTDGVAVSGTTYTAYTSGGYAYRDAGADWDYVYSLPTGCQRILRLLDEEFGYSDTYDWRLQRNWLYCNLEYAGLSYLNASLAVTEYDPEIVELMAARLAWLIAPKITSDETVIRQAYQDWMQTAFTARIINARKKTSVPAPENLWTKVH